MSTATTTPLMTAAEFVRDFGDSTGVELVNGQLVRYPMPGAKHDHIELKAAILIAGFVQQNDLGRAMSGETFIYVRRNPDGIRAADVSFISYARLSKEVPLPDGPLEIPPELVVEIKSPTDRMNAILVKIGEYLAAGVLIVMLIDPHLESVAVFRDGELPIRFHNGDTVTLPDVLPGFSEPVKAFFE